MFGRNNASSLDKFQAIEGQNWINENKSLEVRIQTSNRQAVFLRDVPLFMKQWLVPQSNNRGHHETNMAGIQPAVMVNAAYKYYGQESSPNKKVVLDHLNMTVERGTIYGLLGPSGCGKTTLLSCIVGRRRLDSGEVWVLGGKPGTKGSGVPGPLIGYMPQDIALIGEFTVRDAVYYFGRVFGLDFSRLEARFDFLSKLLELPDSSKLLKHLSGGQQRRVSFAAALVQEPDLLILDEPTVGLDPVLRERIWNYLVDISKAGASVIITTHYIDETKQAHKIGLMRGGKLLAEESPLALMNKFGTETLEEAFLILSVKQSQNEARRHEVQVFDHSGTSNEFQLSNNKSDSFNMNNYNSKEDFTKMCTSSTDTLADSQRDLSEQNRSLKARGYNTGPRSRYKALFIKNIQQFARHPGGLIFSALFPIVQILAFFCSVGHDPRQSPLAVVNLEALDSPFGLGICHNSSLVSAVRVDEDTCNLYMLGCRFLNELDKMDMRLIQFDTLEDAMESAKRGKTIGVLYIARNFSESLEERFKYGTETDDGTIDTSAIIVRLDMSNYQIAHYVRKSLYSTYERFARRLMMDCGREVELARLPVRFLQPVYGNLEPSISTFMAPGIMFTILFFLSATVTSTLMIAERLEGIWDRSVVAGVKPKEILFVHIFIQSIIILLQTLELMVLAFAGYSVPYHGSLLTLGVLLFLQGLSGMCFGFLLSVLFNSYTVAFFVSTGSFYPMILLCGILWPLEGMSKGLRWIALCLPFTVPTRSVRDIMEKGFSITDPSVYIGYIVTVVWIFVLISLCLLRLKWKKN